MFCWAVPSSAGRALVFKGLQLQFAQLHVHDCLQKPHWYTLDARKPAFTQHTQGTYEHCSLIAKLREQQWCVSALKRVSGSRTTRGVRAL